MRALRLTFFFAIIIIGFLIIFFLFWGNSRNNQTQEPVSVQKETTSQEIFATGKVKPAEELNLSFQRGGLILNIFVKEGEQVEKDQILAELDKKELESRLKEAEAKLSSEEERLKTAQTNLQSAKETLFTRIEDSYNKIHEVIFSNTEPLFAGGEFGVSIKEGVTTYNFNTPDDNLKISLNYQRKQILDSINSWKKPSSKNNLIEEAKLVREHLEQAINFVNDLAKAVSDFSTDRPTIAPILSAYRSAVSNSQSSISLAIVNLDSALQNLIVAESKVSDAGVDQAKRQIETIKTQINKTVLKSPTRGKIIKKLALAGEVVQPSQTIFTLYPSKPFRVEAEVYEGDIGNISVGQEGFLEFAAYPDKVFKGKVVEIKPAPLLIDKVVHYLVVLEIIDSPPQIFSGMSVDVRFPPNEKK